MRDENRCHLQGNGMLLEMEKALELLTKRGWDVAPRERRGRGDALCHAQEAVLLVMRRLSSFSKPCR